jgi:hypothetical protein
MVAKIPPEVMQNAANTVAPGVQATPQDQAPNVAKTRKQPGQKGKQTAAQRMYPKLASEDANKGDGD